MKEVLLITIIIMMVIIIWNQNDFQETTDKTRTEEEYQNAFKQGEAQGKHSAYFESYSRISTYWTTLKNRNEETSKFLDGLVIQLADSSKLYSTKDRFYESLKKH